jgi:hypothetical protein
MFCDFDNDGYQDILTSGDLVKFYHNNGDKTFTEETPFAPVVFGSFGLGDLNHDGFMDVYASRVIPFNNPDPNKEDILYLNQGNSNHFIGLRLTDPEKNRSAIGAMAKLYGPWGIQVKEVGVVNNTVYQIATVSSLGLGQNITYDSLVIRWPDKTVEKILGLEIDKYHTLIKGNCASISYQLFDLLEVLCNQDSIILKVDPLYTILEWSTGETSDSIIVKEPGLYYVSIAPIDECYFTSFPIEVTTDPDTIKPVVDFAGKVFEMF